MIGPEVNGILLHSRINFIPLTRVCFRGMPEEKTPHELILKIYPEVYAYCFAPKSNDPYPDFHRLMISLAF